MGLKEVSLPTGGRVWLRTRLTHAQAREREEARSEIPASALGRLFGSGALDGADITISLAGLDDADVALVSTALRRIDEATARVCIHHSAEVVDTDGDAIRLPDDLDRIDEADFSFVIEEARKALAEGYGDPLASRATSATPSSPGGSLETSPTTSETPS